MKAIPILFLALSIFAVRALAQDADSGAVHFSRQGPRGAGAQDHDSSKIVANEIKFHTRDGVVTVTAGPGGSVVLDVADDPEFGKRVQYKDECIELTGRDGAVLCEVRSLVDEGHGKLVYAPRAVRAYLGATVGSAEATLAEQLGLEANAIGVVTAIVDGSPAAGAGLKVHDVITKIDGRDGGRGDQVSAAIANKKPGESLSLTVRRRGKTREIAATLVALDEQAGTGLGGDANPNNAKFVTSLASNLQAGNYDLLLNRTQSNWIGRYTFGPNDEPLRLAGHVLDSTGRNLPLVTLNSARVLGATRSPDTAGAAESRTATDLESLLKKVEARLQEIERKLDAANKK